MEINYRRDGARSENLGGQAVMRRLLFCQNLGGGGRPPASTMPVNARTTASGRLAWIKNDKLLI